MIKDSPARISFGQLERQHYMADEELGYEINSVTDGSGNDSSFTIVGTLMRVDLLRPLQSGQSVEFAVDYAYNIIDGDVLSPRGGFEYFPDDENSDGNYIFTISQWFPRLVAYTDYEGWTNKEFLGSGEFTLEFGNYEVAITYPLITSLRLPAS